MSAIKSIFKIIWFSISSSSHQRSECDRNNNSINNKMTTEPIQNQCIFIWIHCGHCNHMLYNCNTRQWHNGCTFSLRLYRSSRDLVVINWPNAPSQTYANAHTHELTTTPHAIKIYRHFCLTISLSVLCVWVFTWYMRKQMKWNRNKQSEKRFIDAFCLLCFFFEIEW